MWFACKDESVKLLWGLYTPDTVVVTTNPTDAFQPKLENKTLRDSGEVELTLLKPAKLMLKYSENLWNILSTNFLKTSAQDFLLCQ